MLKKYKSTGISSLMRGVTTELEPGIYPMELVEEGPETATYRDPFHGGLLRISISQFRRLGKPNGMYAGWDGQNLYMIEPPIHVKVMLEQGYRIKTEENLLNRRDLVPESLEDFYAKHGFPLLADIPGKVYTNGNDSFRNFPHDDEFFIQVESEGKLLELFSRSMAAEEE